MLTVKYLVQLFILNSPFLHVVIDEKNLIVYTVNQVKEFQNINELRSYMKNTLFSERQIKYITN